MITISVASALALGLTQPAEMPSRGGVHLWGRDVTAPAVLALGALAAHQLSGEERVSSMLDDSALESGLEIGNVYGEGYVLGTAAVLLAGAGRLGGNERAASAGDDLAQSLLISWAAVWALKPTVGGTRPDGGPYSFPSGHAATAFAGAPVLARHFGKGWGIAAYTMASMTALARVEERRHYVVDVLAGAAIGTLVGREVTGASRSPRADLSISPGGLGVAFRL